MWRCSCSARTVRVARARARGGALRFAPGRSAALARCGRPRASPADRKNHLNYDHVVVQSGLQMASLESIKFVEDPDVCPIGKAPSDCKACAAPASR